MLSILNISISIWAIFQSVKPCKWSLTGNHKTSQIMTIFWQCGFKGTPSSFFLSSGWQSTGFNGDLGYWFSRLQWSWGVRTWIGQVTTPQDFLFLLIFSHFFKSSLHCHSLWFISIVLTKLILAIFASTLIAFMERTVRGLYSIILTEATLNFLPDLGNSSLTWPTLHFLYSCFLTLSSGA